MHLGILRTTITINIAHIVKHISSKEINLKISAEYNQLKCFQKSTLVQYKHKGTMFEISVAPNSKIYTY
jgi:hypothetical protein